MGTEAYESKKDSGFKGKVRANFKSRIRNGGTATEPRYVGHCKDRMQRVRRKLPKPGPKRGGRKPSANPLEAVVRFRVTPDQKAQIAALAKKLNYHGNMSVLVRKILFDAIQKEESSTPLNEQAESKTDTPIRQQN